MAEPVIRLSAISKSFAGRAVLRAAGLEVARGEIHGLLGQNGSGKSTLIKILAGQYEPDRPVGTLDVNGSAEPLPLSPQRATELGMAFVHQDLPTASSASVLENLRIGRFRTRSGWRIDWGEERKRATEAMREFGLDLDPTRPAAEISAVEKAMLVILRALEDLPSDRPGILVLDEPTAYLPRDSVHRLFGAIRAVAARGHGVLVVTHRLDEVMSLTDRISVLRDGKVALAVATAETSERELVTAIVGSAVDELYPTIDAPVGQTLLSARRLSGNRLQPFDLDVHAGEIVGVTGLMGSGYEEIPYLLFGAERGRSGTVRIGSTETPQADLRPHLAMRMGLAMLPADRRGAGGAMTASALENMLLPDRHSYFRGGFLRADREREVAASLMDRYEVRPATPGQQLSRFSGGNQQKALLAKWFNLKPRVLLLHDPTQGVDVGARKTIFGHLRDAADAGAGIVLASAEYEDLAHLCSRVFVFRSGRLVAEMTGELSESRILERCIVSDSGTVAA